MIAPFRRRVVENMYALTHYKPATTAGVGGVYIIYIDEKKPPPRNQRRRVYVCVRACACVCVCACIYSIIHT